MNPFHPKVQKFISNLVLEVVKKYDVDGVQGDDRLPALPAKGGYDDYTKNLYKKEHNGYEPPTNHFDSAWTEWRCLRLNNYAKKLYKDVKKIKPDMMVAHAPSLWPWCKKYYLQDWPTWLKDGYADVVLPQLYRYKIEDYQHILDETISYIGKENIPKLFPGILTSLADGFQVKETLLLQMIQANRKSGVMGESFFYFECLRRIPEFFKKNYVGK